MRPLWATDLRADLWDTRPETLRGLIELVRTGDREQRARSAEFLVRWLGELAAAGEMIQLPRSPETRDPR